MKAAATVRIFLCRNRATIVRKLPITPISMITRVSTPAAVIIPFEYLLRKVTFKERVLRNVVIRSKNICFYSINSINIFCIRLRSFFK